MKKMNKKGFTLIEMLAVIAIIAVLAAIIVPAFGSSTTKAKAAVNAANLRSAAATLSIAYFNGEATYDAETKTFTVPEDFKEPVAEEVNGIEGDLQFTVTMVGDEIICTFGENGTIDNYTNIAEDGKLG